MTRRVGEPDDAVKEGGLKERPAVIERRENNKSGKEKQATIAGMRRNIPRETP